MTREYTAANTMPSARRSSAVPSSMLVNIQLHLHRATVGHDISPADEELLVLFRRNSKEVTSNATKWTQEHIATWNQDLPIQTSLLSNINPTVVGNIQFYPKEYDIVLVALPSHSAIALFTFDFADMVQTQMQKGEYERMYRISPVKCRDLAATLEFNIVWEFAQYVNSNAQSYGSPLKGERKRRENTRGTSLDMMTADELNKLSFQMSAQRSRNVSNPQIRTSNGSERSELASSHCHDCQRLRQRTDSKISQVNQLQSQIEELQKRLEISELAYDELLIRESAEAKNAMHFRALFMRMLLEVQSGCFSRLKQAHNDKSTAEFLESINTLQSYYEEMEIRNPSLDFEDSTRISVPVKTRSSRSSTASSNSSRRAPAADKSDLALDTSDHIQVALRLQRRLGQDLEMLTRIAYEAPAISDSSSVKTMTEQMNCLEKENIELRSKQQALDLELEQYKAIDKDSIADLRKALEEAEEKRMDAIQELEACKKRPSPDAQAAPSFLAKIYEDIGKAKVVLGAQVKQQKQQIECLQSELYALQAKDEANQAEIQALQSKILLKDSDFLVQISTYEERLNSAQLRTAELETRIESLQCSLQQQALDTSVSEAKAAAQAKCNELERDLEALQLQLMACNETAQAQCETLTNELKAKETLIQTHLNEISLLTQAAEMNEDQKGTKDKAQVLQLNKELKHARQEVMALRFRSNTLVTLQEKFECAAKEKKAYEIKVQTLQGLLYEQRERSCSESPFRVVPAVEADGDASEQMLAKMTALQARVEELHACNEKQYVKMTALSEKYRAAMFDKEKLSAVLDKLVLEKNKLEKLVECVDQSSHLAKQSVERHFSVQPGRVADLIRNFS